MIKKKKVIKGEEYKGERKNKGKKDEKAKAMKKQGLNNIHL